MKLTNKKHSELAREYNHILAQYRHWLNTIRFLKRQFWSPYEAWDFDHWLRVHKSEVGDARENLNYYATKLRELKQQIKTINKNPIAI